MVFAAHKSPDELIITTDDDSVKDDLTYRYQQLQNRIAGLKIENDEVSINVYIHQKLY